MSDGMITLTTWKVICRLPPGRYNHGYDNRGSFLTLEMSWPIQKKKFVELSIRTNDTDTPDSCVKVMAVISKKTRRQILQQVVDNLNESKRHVLIVEKFTIEDVTNILGISKMILVIRIRKARYQYVPTTCLISIPSETKDTIIESKDVAIHTDMVMDDMKICAESTVSATIMSDSSVKTSTESAASAIDSSVETSTSAIDSSVETSTEHTDSSVISSVNDSSLPLTKNYIDDISITKKDLDVISVTSQLDNSMTEPILGTRDIEHKVLQGADKAADKVNKVEDKAVDKADIAADSTFVHPIQQLRIDTSDDTLIEMSDAIPHPRVPAWAFAKGPPKLGKFVKERKSMSSNEVKRDLTFEKAGKTAPPQSTTRTIPFSTKSSASIVSLRRNQGGDHTTKSKSVHPSLAPLFFGLSKKAYSLRKLSEGRHSMCKVHVRVIKHWINDASRMKVRKNRSNSMNTQCLQIWIVDACHSIGVIHPDMSTSFIFKTSSHNLRPINDPDEILSSSIEYWCKTFPVGACLDVSVRSCNYENVTFETPSVYHLFKIRPDQVSMLRLDSFLAAGFSVENRSRLSDFLLSKCEKSVEFCYEYLPIDAWSQCGDIDLKHQPDDDLKIVSKLSMIDIAQKSVSKDTKSIVNVVGVVMDVCKTMVGKTEKRNLIVKLYDYSMSFIECILWQMDDVSPDCIVREAVMKQQHQWTGVFTAVKPKSIILLCDVQVNTINGRSLTLMPYKSRLHVLSHRCARSIPSAYRILNWMTHELPKILGNGAPTKRLDDVIGPIESVLMKYMKPAAYSLPIFSDVEDDNHSINGKLVSLSDVCISSEKLLKHYVSDNMDVLANIQTTFGSQEDFLNQMNGTSHRLPEEDFKLLHASYDDAHSRRETLLKRIDRFFILGICYNYHFPTKQLPRLVHNIKDVDDVDQKISATVEDKEENTDDVNNDDEVTNIKIAIDETKLIWYPSCPRTDSSCLFRQPMYPEEDTRRYRCPCGHMYSEGRLRYCIPMRIADHSGLTNARIFDMAGAELFDQKYTAGELEHIQIEDPVKYQVILNSVLNTPYLFEMQRRFSYHEASGRYFVNYSILKLWKLHANESSEYLERYMLYKFPDQLRELFSLKP